MAGLWALAHRWQGLQQDGVLYAAQAMSHVRPDVFRGDLFFAYGSQDDFTVFGRLYAAAVEAMGLTWASRSLWAVSQLLWFGVAIAWVRRVVASRYLLVAAAVVFALPAYYSSDSALRVAESVLTARSFAEPLALAGLLAIVLGRTTIGWVAILLAALFHPIMAMPGAVSAGLLIARRDFGFGWRSTVALFFGGALAILLLLAGGLFSRMDANWFALASLRSPFVMAGEWEMRDWIVLVYPVFVLALIGRYSDGRWGPTWCAIAAAGAIGLALSVLAWATRWELGLQAQTWRFLWIAAWAAPLAALSAALALPGSMAARRIIVLATIPAMALTEQFWWTASWILPVVHAGALAIYLRRPEPDTRAARALAFVLAGLLLVAVILGVVLHIAGDDIGTPGRLFEPYRIKVGLGYLSWAVLGVAAWFVSRGSGARWRQLGTRVFAVAVVVGAATLWDARNQVATNLDRLAGAGIPAWSAVIPEDATVYWPERLRYVWFVLQRRSYVSKYQLAGGIFGRETLEEGQRRLDNARFIGGKLAVLSFRNISAFAAPRPPVRADLERACADPVLDFVVLDRELAPTAAAPFVEPAGGKRFYLYRCAEAGRAASGFPGTIPALP